jgi:hypothetical protein
VYSHWAEAGYLASNPQYHRPHTLNCFTNTAKVWNQK